MEQREDLLAEAVRYFKNQPGMHRLLGALVDKYRSLGRFGGIVVLDEPSREERAVLEAFLRKRLSGEQVCISVKQFSEVFADTKFGSLDLLDVLQTWHGGEIVGKQQERARRDQARAAMFRQFMAKYPHPFCQTWLTAILAQENGTQRVRQAVEQDPQFARNMAIALKAVSQLPDEYQRLPIFARNICGNPHGLDLEGPAGKLFLDGLRCIRAASEDFDNGVDTWLSAAEEIGELLYRFKLVRDDVLNFATCYGLAAYNNNREIAYWRAAAQAGAPLNIPLREILRVNRFVPVAGQQSDTGPFTVYIVENSGVFSALLDRIAGPSCGEGGAGVTVKPLMCLHGQFKLASWALLDRLIQDGAMLCYSGDFDPEGLQMAQKLLFRYPGRVQLWHMTERDYLASLPSVSLNQSRLNKLKSIIHPVLTGLATQIAERETAGYQEGLIDLLVQEFQASEHEVNNLKTDC